ncbi:putative inorganic phosphate cotransporter [Coccinella septempunctata]|uniref:putative inorganic phosphate cotransporter n=1 Tax=Coccinella septempunctata TaxID=41139 RepID=UPI001D091420|nr:putative inorganic phosphate cotransporter [Coccinella septempunctata]
MNKNEIPGFGVRHTQVLLMFSWNVLYTSMVNGFPMCLVAMTNAATSPNPRIPTFSDWQDSSIILSAYFWGFVTTQLFGGYNGRRYGVKWFMVTSMLITSIICFVIPSVVVNFGSIGLILGVMIAGLAQGFSYTMLPVFISSWVPFKEKTTLGNAIYAGYGVGCVLGINVATRCSISWYGWPLSFYISGTMQLFWSCFMTIFGENEPEHHKSISDAEVRYILEGKNFQKRLAVPWRTIFNSREVWSLWIAHGGAVIITWLSAAEFPVYLSDVFEFNLEQVCNIMTMSFLLIGVLSIGVSVVVEYFINVWQIPTGSLRKVCNSIASFGSSFMLICMANLTNLDRVKVVFFTLSIFCFNAASFSGYLLNYNDISPNFCGVIFGLGGMVSSIMNIANPILISIYVRDQSDPREWALIFWSSAVVMIVSNIIFLMFGSGEKQKWDDCPEEKR